MKSSLIEPKVRRARMLTGEDNEQEGAGSFYPVAAGFLAAPRTPLLLAAKPRRKTLLLVSKDAGFGNSLGHTASHANLAFQQVSDIREAFRLAQAERPAAVFVDLDLPEQDGWKAVEKFLQGENGPPLVLLTGRTGHFDLGMAVRAGIVLDKLSLPAELDETVNGLLAIFAKDPAHGRAGQRLLLRWLRPYDWGAPVPAIHRHWGINE